MYDICDRPTASILPFPARPRRAPGVGFKTIRSESSPVALLPSGVAVAECGGGWYHDDAIQEAERVDKSYPVI